MEQLFDTLGFDDSEAFDAYQGALERALVPLRVRRPPRRDGGFHARVAGAELGDLNLVHAAGDAHSTEQTAADAARNPYGAALLMPLGQCTMAHRLHGTGDSGTRLSSGGMLISACRQPGRMDLHDRADVVTLHIPPGKLPGTLEDRLARGALELPPERSGEARLLGSFVRALPGALADTDRVARAHLGEHFLGLLSLALRAQREDIEAPLEDLDMADVHFRSARSVMQRRLDDPALSPELLARELALSERHVYRVFAQRGTSFRDELRRLRLQRAAEALADDSLGHLRLTDIALLAGFSNVSYFSRVFRTGYGCTPSEYRRTRVTH